MNRIYQGDVTKVEILFPSSEGRVEIANPHILSASTGERTEVRCRIPFNQFSTLNFPMNTTNSLRTR